MALWITLWRYPAEARNARDGNSGMPDESSNLGADPLFRSVIGSQGQKAEVEALLRHRSLARCRSERALPCGHALEVRDPARAAGH